MSPSLEARASRSVVWRALRLASCVRERQDDNEPRATSRGGHPGELPEEAAAGAPPSSHRRRNAARDRSGHPRSGRGLTTAGRSRPGRPERPRFVVQRRAARDRRFPRPRTRRRSAATRLLNTWPSAISLQGAHFTVGDRGQGGDYEIATGGRGSMKVPGVAWTASEPPRSLHGHGLRRCPEVRRQGPGKPSHRLRDGKAVVIEEEPNRSAAVAPAALDRRRGTSGRARRSSALAERNTLPRVLRITCVRQEPQSPS